MALLTLALHDAVGLEICRPVYARAILTLLALELRHAVPGLILALFAVR
eukprot:CAMPEP_0206056432 /NCGR_PEP_ID=MMETSP1466-20131121/42204_1 /ASSEMBLY_ACC=CAM_ASM_001126 /TAXON_ID=44452 /ORGANISM="Pavlova gyrans, Strain CCMP608" /LENGTH=48 /DNA_ID= /DNA_START= /DNA_END= /DNA_ORIENTATION=